MNDNRSEPDFNVLPLSAAAATGSHSPSGLVGFERAELEAIFDVYGRMVAEGLWRDYALDFSTCRAIFSVFRRTGEAAFYRIVKEPKAAKRHGAYSVIAQTGLILKRGHDLTRVLAILEKKPKLVTF